MQHTEFSEILHEITGGINPICTMKEIAFVMGKDVQTLYCYRKGDTQPSWNDTCRLSCFLIEQHGYYKLGMQSMMVCKGKANGKVSDDLMEIYGAGTDLHRAFKDGDKTAYINAIARMEQELKDLKAEGNSL